MEVWFLDVGQGDGIFFRTGTAAVLTDCGSSQYKSVGKNRLVPFLKSKGIRRLDYISSVMRTATYKRNCLDAGK